MAFPLVFAAGGPRERGRAYGAQARDRVHRTVALYEEVFAYYADLGWDEVRRRAQAFVDPIDAYDVTLLPEVEGIAEGAGLDAEDVLAANLRTEIMFGLDARPGKAAMKECTAMAAGGDGPIVGQTWDWKPGSRDTVVLLVCAPHDRPGFVTIVEAGLWAKCGMNEAGLALATNALQSSRDHGEPGVPYHAVLRRAITSATLEEARDAILRGPRASSANYLIGHRDGGVEDLEALPGGPSEVHRTAAPALAHTNHFLRPAPRAFKDLGRIDGEDSLTRHTRAEATLAAGSAAVEDLETAFASHADEAGPICVHEDAAQPGPARYATIAAMVAETATGTMHVAEGNPCEQPFETYSLTDLLDRVGVSG